MTNAHEMLKRRYLQALEDLIDRPGIDRRWIPCVAIGEDNSEFLNAAFHAAMGVGRSMVVLQLSVNEESGVQHRVHVAHIVGGRQRVVRNGVLWAPDAIGRMLVIPRSGTQRFHFSVCASGEVERHAGLPARDTAFGIALAAKRLRDGAAAAVPMFDKRVLSCATLVGRG